MLGSLLATSVALAGPYTDDLAKCLVDSTTAQDRVTLVRWMFIAFAAHPSVASLTTIQPADVDKANAEFGNITMRLLTESCREKTKTAVKFEGLISIQASFQTLGQVAGFELGNSPEVQARMAGIQTQVDSSRIKALLEEAGVAAPH
jgi:hypothetical protein